MENARIFKLEGPVKVSSSFEEAFGEFSEARGKGRQRRQERKLDRIQKRSEVKAAKQQAKAQKQQGRIANRASRQEARQQKRTVNMGLRQDRRTQRKQFRTDRQAIGKEQEVLTDDQGVLEEGQIPDTGGTGFGVSDGAAYTNESQGGQGGQGGGVYGYGDEEEQPPYGEYETTEEGDVEAGEEESAEDEEGYGADGINYEDLGPNDELLTLEPDDFYSYMDDYASVDGTPAMVKGRINPNVKTVAVKAEWNKEKASRLKDRINQVQGVLDSGSLRSNYDIGRCAKMLSDLKEQYILCIDRAQGFDGILSDYSNAEDDISNADDDTSDASGRRSVKNRRSVKKKKKAEVKAAKREARKLRVRAKNQKKSAKRMSKRSGGAVPVDADLGPEFDNQQITIPASELSTGANGKTGLIALDDANDLDSPSERQIDIKLSADGDYSYASGKKTNWTGIAIGVAIAGFAIWFGKKQKWY